MRIRPNTANGTHPRLAGRRPTDVDNLTLVCRYHHHHFEHRGWTCRLNPDRLPEWIPPRHVDRTQTPQVNTRIQAAHAHFTPGGVR